MKQKNVRAWIAVVLTGNRDKVCILLGTDFLQKETNMKQLKEVEWRGNQIILRGKALRFFRETAREFKCTEGEAVNLGLTIGLPMVIVSKMTPPKIARPMLRLMEKSIFYAHKLGMQAGRRAK